MIVKGNQKLRKVYGLTDIEEEKIVSFLKEDVHKWRKTHNSDWFALRDLRGGDKADWAPTPLIALYKKHKSKNKTEPQVRAGAKHDAGWLLKWVIFDDKKFRFETEIKDGTRKYR